MQRRNRYDRQRDYPSFRTADESHARMLLNTRYAQAKKVLDPERERTETGSISEAKAHGEFNQLGCTGAVSAGHGDQS